MTQENFDIEPIQQKSLSEEVAERILTRIRQLTPEASKQLPSTRVLARQLGVSVPVLREALARLSQAGIVEIVHGSGVFVRDGIDDMVRVELGRLTFVELDELVRLLELRLGIESEAARLAALRRSPASLEKIEKALHLLQCEIQEGHLADEPDYQFHRAIAESTNNPVFSRISDVVESQFRHGIFVSRARSLTVPGRPQLVFEEHQRVWAAIRDQDSERAYQAMRTHVQAAMDRLLEKP